MTSSRAPDPPATFHPQGYLPWLFPPSAPDSCPHSSGFREGPRTGRESRTVGTGCRGWRRGSPWDYQEAFQKEVA